MPIHSSSTFVQDGVGGLREGYEYARTANPTRTALETCLAALEGGLHGRAFASGMAASDVLLRATCRPGDHIVIPDDAYGGTFRLIDKVFRHWGIEHTAVGQSDLDAVRAAMRPNTRLVWCETPTNPLLNIADVAALAAVAHEADARLVVDNTFATPYLQTPLPLGADVVLHSTTKYLGGHSDVIGGALITDDAELDEQVAFLQNGAGAVPGPFDAWLTLRESRPWRCGWSDTVTTPSGSSLRCRRTRPSPVCAIPVWPPTVAMRSPPSRCAGSVESSRSPSKVVSRRRWLSAPAPGCSPWPSR